MDILLVGFASICVGAFLAYFISSRDMLNDQLYVVSCGGAVKESGVCRSIDDARSLTGKPIPEAYSYVGLMSKGVFERQEINIRISGIERKDRIRLEPVIVKGNSMLGLGIVDGDILWIATGVEANCQPNKLVVLAHAGGTKVKVRELIEPHPEDGWWITRSRYEHEDCFARHHENQILGIVRFHTEMPRNLRQAA